MKPSTQRKATPRNIVACIVASLREEMFVGHWNVICRVAHWLWAARNDDRQGDALHDVTTVALTSWASRHYGERWKSALCKRWSSGDLKLKEVVEIVVWRVNQIANDCNKHRMIAKENRWLLDTEYVLGDDYFNPRAKSVEPIRQMTDPNWIKIESALFGDPDKALERLKEQYCKNLNDQFSERRAAGKGDGEIFADEAISELGWRWNKINVFEDWRLWEAIKEFIARMEKQSGRRFGFTVWKLWMASLCARAWMNRDAEFLARHAETWRALCHSEGARLPRPTETEVSRKYRVQEIAWTLRGRLERSPTKKEVREEATAKGIIMEKGDWAKKWKPYLLDFLSAERGGRPSAKKNSRH